MSAKKPRIRLIAKAAKLTPRARALTKAAGLASHAAMGAALGLVFAFIATRSPMFGVTPILAKMTSPETRVFDFALTSAVAFAVVATMTGIAAQLGDDPKDGK